MSPAAEAYLLLLAYEKDARQDLLFCKLCEAHNGTAALDWLNDLGGLIACQSKSGSVAVDLHGAPKRLLRSTGHAASQHVKCEMQVCV